MVEKITFGMSNQLLRDIITRQAGSIVKAIQEGIQNPKDADAKNVIVNIHEDMVEIVDDGIGMDMRVILNNFAIFGDSSKRGDRTKIGEFGMGRGQMFAHGVTDIFTRKFHLHVDITKEDEKGNLFFSLDETDKEVKGCQVMIKLFEKKKISSWRIDPIVQELLERFMFNGMTVTINGNVIPPVKGEGRVFKNGDVEATFHEKNGKSSRIFVKGIFVTTTRNFINSYDILVNNLTLNFARNDFIEDELFKCFMKITDDINIEDINSFDRRKMFEHDDILHKLMIFGNLIDKEVTMNLKFIRSYEGAYYTPKIIFEKGGAIADVSSYDESMRYKAANIYKNNFGGLVANLTDNQKYILEKLGIKIIDVLTHKDTMEKMNELLNKEMNILDIKKKVDIAIMKKIEVMSYLVAGEIGINYRKIIPVSDTSYDMCTDGKTYVKVNWDILSKKKYINKKEIDRFIFDRLLHEYAHDGDSESGSHDINFYERFHMYVMRSSGIYSTFELIPHARFFEDKNSFVIFTVATKKRNGISDDEI